MTSQQNRSNRIALVVGVAVVAFAVGLTLALWGPDSQRLQGVMTVLGALLAANGLFLLASPGRYLIERDADVPPAIQIPAEQMALRRMRVIGANGILMGVALLVPDVRARAALLICAAAVSWAGVLRLPRRFFVLKDGTGG